MKAKKVVRFGVKVWANTEMDGRRREECLCFNCALVGGKCGTAEILYKICVARNLALMVTRCPEWKEVER